MCELFAMSARLPSTVTFSLEEFSRHGGLTGPHKDGWGLAWYDEGDVHLRKEALPAFSSEGIHAAQQHPFLSPLVLCHIRKATQGVVATRNCQPFIRELGGAWHTFAHNGDLDGIRDMPRFQTGAHRPIGETDSEHAFCALLERLQSLWRQEHPPSVDARIAVISRFAAELKELGPANFLYSDGELLVAHGHKRRQTDGSIRAPGLWRLERHCLKGGSFDTGGLSVEARGQAQDVMLLASVPLSSEPWQPLPEGSIVALRLGQQLSEGLNGAA